MKRILSDSHCYFCWCLFVFLSRGFVCQWQLTRCSLPSDSPVLFSGEVCSKSIFPPGSLWSDNAVGCLQQKDTDRADAGAAQGLSVAASLLVIWNIGPMHEGDICHQKGKHILTWTTCAHTISSNRGIEVHSQWWLRSSLLWGICGPGMEWYYLVCREGRRDPGFHSVLAVMTTI